MHVNSISVSQSESLRYHSNVPGRTLTGPLHLSDNIRNYLDELGDPQRIVARAKYHHQGDVDPGCNSEIVL